MPDDLIAVNKINSGVNDLDSNGHDAGDQITYNYTVSNPGANALLNVSLNDDQLGSVALADLTDEDSDGSNDDLAAGASATGMATATLTQTQVDAGAVTNVATATGTATPPGAGEDLVVTATATASNTVVIEQHPAISIDKTNGGVVDANTDGHQDAGDQVQYNYAVSNTGNVTLFDVVASDNQLGAITLAGLTDQDGDGTADDLAAGASATGSATATVTQAQIDAGYVTNAAVAIADPPNEGQFVFDITANTILINQEPSIAIDKSNGGVVDANADGQQDVGDQIVYDYTVSNAGNVTLFNVTASDDQLGAITLAGLTDQDGDGDADDLAVGASATGTATATLTQDQVDAGFVANAAEADAQTPNEGQFVFGLDSNTVLIEQTPTIAIDKSNGGVVDANADGQQDVGDQIVYDYTVSNAGNVTLFNVTASDDQLGAITLAGLTDQDGDGDADDLAVGASATGSAIATLDQTQVDAGSLSNTATATGTAPGEGGDVSGTDSNTVSIEQTPTIAIDKSNGGVVDANADGQQDVGDQIVYDYTVSNAGNVTLFNVTASDDQLGAITLAGLTDQDGDGDADDLAVGASATGTATATLTQDQVDAGFVANAAEADAQTPNEGQFVFGLDSNTVLIEQTPTIAIDKSNGGVVDANADGQQDVGDQIVYDYTVSNAGNVTLFNVTASDDQLGAITLAGLTDQDGDGDADDLAVGASATGSAIATLDQTQVDAGSLSNTATATGTAPGEGGDVSGTDSNTVSIEQTPTIAIDKSNGGVVDANADGQQDVGDQIVYDYTVSNAGNVTLFNVTASDDQLGAITLAGLTDQDGDGDADDLAVGASATGTATATLTQDQVDAGFVANAAEADAQTPNEGQFVFGLDSNTVLIEQTPTIAIDKSNGGVVDANADGQQDVGDQIVYDYTVSNAGNVTLFNVTASDDQLGAITLAGLTDQDGDGDADDLAVGASATGSAIATLDQTQVDAGSLSNTATATGTAPGEGGDVSGTDSNTVSIEQTPTIAIDKSNGGVVDANADGQQDVGDQIVYDYTVSNAGNVTLFNVTASDDQLGAITLAGLTDQDGDGDADDLAVGASATGTATATLTQDQVDAGFVANAAEADAQTPNEGQFVFGLDSNTVLIEQTPTIAIDKSNGGVVDANADGQQDVGDQIVYDYTVSNAGNVTLFNVTASDDQLGAITLAGLTDQDGDGDADDLAVGASATGSAIATLDQTQVDAGSLSNTATATGTAPGEGGDVSGTDSNTVSIEQTPTIAIDKSNGGVVDANADGQQDVGDQIVYDYTVSNAGNVTLFNVTASDDQLGAITLAGLTDQDGDGDADDLAVGASATGTATATLTQDQVDAGFVANAAEADAQTPNEGQFVFGLDSNTVLIEQTPTIAIDKSNGGVVDANADGQQDVGDQIVYDYTVSNAGNVTLFNVTASDDQLGAITLAGLTDQDGDGDADDLAVGASATGSAIATLDQTQVDAGSLSNTATATGTAPGEGGDVSGTDSNTVSIEQTPTIAIDKSNGGVVDANADGQQDVGDQIVYDYTVSNAGNVTLFNVTASDDQLGAITLAGLTDQDGDGDADDLAVGASATGTATATLTQDQVDAGFVANAAEADAQTPNEGQFVFGLDSNTVLIEQTPTIAIDKSNGGVVDANADGQQDVGDQIVYDYTVSNAGNVTLFNVTASDDQLGAITLAGLTDQDGDGDADDLAVGASATGSAIATLDQTQVDAGSLSNTATATGTAPGEGGDVSGTDSNTVSIEQTPTIAIDKSNGGVVDANADGQQDVGDQIVYDYTVSNAGNVTLFNVTASDDQLGAITLAGLTDQDGDGDADDLAVGASATGTATATLTQDQVDAGFVANAAEADAQTPNEGQFVFGLDSNTVLIEQTPTIAIDKSNGGVVDANADGQQDVGDQIVYDYTVSNAGNVTLFNVTASDDQLGAITLAGLTDQDGDGDADDLAVGASATGSAIATLDQTQVDAGSLSNTATATGTAPGEGGDVSGTDSNTVSIEQTPTIAIDKSNGGVVDANADGQQDVGDQIVYDYTVSNAGNVALFDVALFDNQLGTITLTGLTDQDGDGQADDLAVGGSVTGTATATLTQDQVDAGFVTNAAIATAAPAAHDQFIFDLTTNTLLLRQTPSIAIDKSNGGVVDANTDGQQDAGDQIVYNYAVSNTGNVALFNVAVSDDQFGSITLAGLTDQDGDGQADDLAVGGAATGTATATLTQAQVDAGSVTNTATATGKAPLHGATATATDTNTVAIEHENQSHACGQDQESSGNGCGDWLVSSGSHHDVFGEEGHNDNHWQGQNSHTLDHDACGSLGGAAFAMAQLEHGAALHNN